MDSLSACPSGARSTKGTTPRYCDCAALLNRNVFQIRFCRRSSARLAAVDPGDLPQAVDEISHRIIGSHRPSVPCVDAAWDVIPVFLSHSRSFSRSVQSEHSPSFPSR